MSEKAAPPPGFIDLDGSSSSSAVATAPPVAAAESTPAPPYQNMGYPVNGPPPSYQNAMSYPTSAPPYPPNSVPNIVPYPTQPIYVPPNITVTTLPQPPIQPVRQQPARVVVQVTQGPGCTHCGSIMQKESDVCCILCLIVLAICTFPFGLFFLCCLPCAVQMRCPGCGRSM